MTNHNAKNVIIVTGATDGLGRALSERLAKKTETRLILHGRDPKKLDAIRAELENSPAEIDTVCADFSELDQVRRAAAEITELTDRITVLVNNAGVGVGEPDGTNRRLTVDNNELRFAVNYLAVFSLTQSLLPLLEAGAPARIVNVASLGQNAIDFDDITLANDYSGRRAYGQSKLALITYSNALAARLDPAHVTVNSLHPGTYMPTKMVLESVGYSVDSLETGVAAALHLIDDDELTGVTGKFFDQQQEGTPLAEAHDQQVQERLWVLSEEKTRIS